MIKYWNHDRGYGMKGFFLEMWARDIFQYWSLPSYAQGVYRFFERGVAYIDSRYSVLDPATSVDLVQLYLRTDTRRSDARLGLLWHVTLLLRRLTPTTEETTRWPWRPGSVSLVPPSPSMGNAASINCI
jgi:hypothetical protein